MNLKCMFSNSEIKLVNGVIVTQENSYASGIEVIFGSALNRLVTKMQEMSMDKTELGCLRAIVLFNPDAKGLGDVDRVEELRDMVFDNLEKYTR